MHTALPGKTSWKRFSAAMVLSTMALSGIGFGASSGLIAFAADSVQTPFTVAASAINGSTFKMVPGSNQETGAGSAPSGVVSMDGKMTNLTITKDIPVPGTSVTIHMKITAGDNGTDVNATGLLIDTNSIQADQGGFTNMIMDAGTGLSAPALTMTNATLQVPYLSVNSITLPHMNVAVSFS